MCFKSSHCQKKKIFKPEQFFTKHSGWSCLGNEQNVIVYIKHLCKLQKVQEKDYSRITTMILRLSHLFTILNLVLRSFLTQWKYKYELWKLYSWYDQCSQTVCSWAKSGHSEDKLLVTRSFQSDSRLRNRSSSHISVCWRNLCAFYQVHHHFLV